MNHQRRYQEMLSCWLVRQLGTVVVWVMLMFGFAVPLWAGPKTVLRFTRISTEQGLSHSKVYAVLQDSKGLMWFGTEDGLNKYDGYNVTIYKHDPADPHSLSHNRVMTLYEDSTGILWVGTLGGLHAFDRHTETFTLYQNDVNDPQSLSHNSVWTIYEDRQKTLWIGTLNGGLNRLHRDTHTFTHYQIDPANPNSLSDDTVLAMYEDAAGRFWIGTTNGLNHFMRDENRFVRYFANPKDPNSLSHNYISSLDEGSDGTLWVGTANGLNAFSAETGQSRQYHTNPYDPLSLSSNTVSAVHVDRSGELWVGTLGGGVSRFDRERQLFLRYQNDVQSSDSLGHNEVWTLYEDRTGVLWIGTMGGGISVTSRKSEQFAIYRAEPNNPGSLSHNDVRAIYEDHEGSLWVGTLEGLNRLDRKTGRFTQYRHDPADPGSLSYNAVWSIYEDREGTLWVGTLGGLNKFDRDTERFTHYLPNASDPQSVSFHKIWPMYEDHTGTLWIGTLGGGLNTFDHTTGKFTRYVTDPSNPRSLSHNVVSSIYEDRNGILWIGTNGGLNRFDRERDRFTRFQNDPKNPDSLSSDAVLALYEDQRGTLWVGTANGLNAYNPRDKTFTHYYQRNGLPSDVIYGIVEDSQGYLWISTNKGLSKFHPETHRVRNFDIRDGLQSNEFNIGAYYKNKDGELFFGSLNGLTAFYPEQIQDNPHAPPIVLTDFQLFNKSVIPGDDAPISIPVSEVTDIRLTYKDSVFSFEFVALDFTILEKNQYAYMMEGFDSAWIPTTAQKRFATYTNLNGGHYTFRVKASNSDGVWNEEGVTVRLTITPPPWKTWWAYSLYVLAVAGLFFGYVRYKTKAQQEELERQRRELEQERFVTERLRQFDKLKDEFLANTSHELRTPLTGIIGIAESLFDVVAQKNVESVYKNLFLIISSGKRLASLVNDILDFSKMKSHTLEIQHKPVYINVVAEVVLTLNNILLAGKDITLENNIRENIPPVRGDEDRLQQILHNLIGNAIKFTDSGIVSISARLLVQKSDLPASFSPDSNHNNEQGASSDNFPMVAVSVSDTGIGIPQEKLTTVFQSFEQVDASTTRTYGGTGLGLAITRQLVELHGGMIWAESVPGKGSTFTFTLPVSEEIPKLESSLQQLVEQRPSLSHMRETSITGEEMVSVDEIVPDGEFTVLVVDDEAINQQVLLNHLAVGEYHVLQASNGIEALQLLERGQHVDLVLLDIMMPKMSGYDVAKKIRKTYLPSELPIIMLTAKNQVSDLVTGFSCGANDYLAKPFSKHELLSRIKTHLYLVHINKSYSRFVPFEFMKELGRDNILDVKLGDHVHKDMTVLFSDIRSYTTLAEAMTPQETFNFLNGYLGRIGPVIREHGGFVNQYYGDGIMAIFPNSPEDSLRAAIAMQRKVAEYNRSREQKGRRPIKIGIGLNTGPLMLGVIGDGRRTDTSVVADSVNAASRMEGLTKFYGVSIIASETTFAGVANPADYQYRFLDKVRVKGKQRALHIYEMYDSESEESITLKRDTQHDFEMGQQHYFSKEFMESVLCFRQVLRQNRNDMTAQLFLERAVRLGIEGVSEDWDGIEQHEQK